MSIVISKSHRLHQRGTHSQVSHLRSSSYRFSSPLAQWESAASEAEGTRLTIVRTGVVLEKDGGALAKILPIYYTFAGGPVGSGRNWFSWIHRTDLVRGAETPSSFPARKTEL